MDGRVTTTLWHKLFMRILRLGSADFAGMTCVTGNQSSCAKITLSFLLRLRKKLTQRLSGRGSVDIKLQSCCQFLKTQLLQRWLDGISRTLSSQSTTQFLLVAHLMQMMMLVDTRTGFVKEATEQATRTMRSMLS